MPRVSQEHLDARRRQILDAARACFVRDGFHATSMQDILGEARLSAGAVYRYFRSKDEIIRAIATTVMEEFAGVFEQLLEAPEVSLNEGVDALVEAMERLHHTQDLPKLIVTIWGEGIRSPELAAIYEQLAARLRGLLTRGAERLREAGRLPAGTTPEGLARVLLGALQGNVIQLAVLPDADPADFRRNLHALLMAATRPDGAEGGADPGAGAGAERPKGAVAGQHHRV